jgi:hypothetical protein
MKTASDVIAMHNKFSAVRHKRSLRGEAPGRKALGCSQLFSGIVCREAVVPEACRLC